MSTSTTINDFGNDTAAFMRWLAESDQWNHGYVRGRCVLDEGYDQLFFNRCKELEKLGVGGLSFLFMLASTTSTQAEQDRQDKLKREISVEIVRHDA